MGADEALTGELRDRWATVLDYLAATLTAYDDAPHRFYAAAVHR